MTLLNPAYLAEARPAAEVAEAETEGVSLGKRRAKEETLNAKLKQFFEAKTQIKPFYTGGKICMLNDSRFVCQCGSGIKVVQTSAFIKIEKQEGNEEEIEIDDEEIEKPVAIIENKSSDSFSILRDIDVPLDETISFDVCPVTDVLITSHKSKLLRIWCLRTGELVKVIKSIHQQPISFIEINKEKAWTDVSGIEENGEKDVNGARGQLTWCTVAGAGVKLWEMGGNQMSKLINVDNIALIGYSRWGKESTSEKFFAAERHIYILGTKPDSKQFVVLQTLEGHYSQVTGIEFDGNKHLVSGGRDKVIILWDLNKNFQKITTIPFPNPIEGLFLQQKHNLFVAVNPSEMLFFDLKSKRLRKKPVLSLNEDEIITGISNTEYVKNLRSELNNCLISTHTGSIYEVIIPQLKVFEELTISRQYVGSLDEILCTVFWTGNTVAVANNTNVIKVYTMDTGSCRFLRGHKDIVLSLGTHKNWLVSGGKDNNVILWKDDSAEPVVILSGHLASVTSVTFNPVDILAYSASEDKFLKSWNTSTCLKSVLAHDKEINCVHCAPNGALVVTGSRDKTAKIWDSESLNLMGTLKGHRKGVWDAKFSSWDQLVATSSADTSIKIWSLATFECIQTLQGHLSSVLQLYFINSGLQIVSTSSDGSFKTWELKTSSCLTTEECGNDKIWALDALPDGSTLVTGSADSSLILWNDITEQKVTESSGKRQKLIEDEQKLNNVIRGGKWMEAFTMALDLDRPYTLLKVIREVSEIEQFQSVMGLLNDDQTRRLLRYLTQWNTNTKSSTEAQLLMSIFFKTLPDKYLHFVEPTKVLPYTEKHFARLKRMQQQMLILNLFADTE